MEQATLIPFWNKHLKHHEADWATFVAGYPDLAAAVREHTGERTTQSVLKMLESGKIIAKCQWDNDDIYAFEVLEPHACRRMLWALLPDFLHNDDRSHRKWALIDVWNGHECVAEDPTLWFSDRSFWIQRRLYDKPQHTASYKVFVQQTYPNLADFYETRRQSYWDHFPRMTVHEVCFYMCLELSDKVTIRNRHQTTGLPIHFETNGTGIWPSYFDSPDSIDTWHTRLCLVQYIHNSYYDYRFMSV